MPHASQPAASAQVIQATIGALLSEELVQVLEKMLMISVHVHPC